VPPTKAFAEIPCLAVDTGLLFVPILLLPRPHSSFLHAIKAPLLPLHRLVSDLAPLYCLVGIR